MVRTSNQGFSIVEVLVAAAAAAFGIVALVNLQVSSLGAARASHDLTLATTMAAHFAEFIEARTLFCNTADPSDPNCVFRPDATVTVDSVTAADWTLWTGSATGSDVRQRAYLFDTSADGAAWDNGLEQEFGSVMPPRYCVYYRTAWMTYPDELRAEVTVYWPRYNANRATYQTCPSTLPTDVTVDSVTVTQTIAVGLL